MAVPPPPGHLVIIISTTDGIDSIDLLQSKPVNTDFEGATERIRINGVSLLTGSRYSSQKDTFYWSKILKKLMRT